MNIREYYQGKKILITGTTGFLGKVVLEKLLWEVPDLKKIVLLVRPAGGSGLTPEGALARFESHILPSRIFERLRERESDFSAFMREKIHASPCDFFQPDLGIPEKERADIFSDLDAVIHVAAQVSWDERLDYSIRVNTLATGKLMEYAKMAARSPRFVYVSSAYVNGQRSGKLAEVPFTPDRSIANELGKAIPFSVDAEIQAAFDYAHQVETETKQPAFQKKLIRKAKHDLACRDDICYALPEYVEILTEKHIRDQLSEYGIQRATLHGWTDSYCLSKAMGEMLLVREQADMPLAIVRPPGITSAVKDPAPGWIEGFHLVEPLIVGMGKGLIKAFPGARESLIDTVPVDYVVNLIVSACAALEKADKPYVYQIGTSDTNPITLQEISKIWRGYFVRNPMTADNGKPVTVGPIKFYSSVQTFIHKIQWQYLYPLNIAENVLDLLQFAKGARLYRRMFGWVARNQKKARRVVRFSDLYSAYTMNSWIFATDNAMQLYRNLSAADQEHFDFNPAKLDWQQFWNETHIPGMKKYVLKEKK